MEKKEIWEVALTKPAEKIDDKSSKKIKRRLDGCFDNLERNPLYGNNIKRPRGRNQIELPLWRTDEKTSPKNKFLQGNSIKHLTGKLKGLYRYRVGDWRIIYRLFKKSMIVEIVAILPRGDAY